MAANANAEYKVFKYYEGLCSSADFPKEIAKVLSLGVKSGEVTDIDGKVLEAPSILKSKNWDIVYPAPDTSLGLDLENLTVDEYKTKILNQVSKISDTVILKTTTTPKELTGEEVDDLTVDADSNKASLTMYLEIYKPTYIANPEEYPLDCERSGIIPKLITKDMYIQSMKATQAAEEYIYASPICTVDNRDDTTTGSIDMLYAECDSYVSMINDVYGNMSFSIPPVDGGSTSITINAAYLAKIKQDSAALYNLICDTLDGGEGIEPKAYTLLDTLKIELYKDGDMYNMIFEGIKKISVYTIPKGSSFTVAKNPIEELVPEFYLDGTYIPLETSRYHTDMSAKKIFFDDNIVFESSTNGLLVVRYEHETSGNEAITERATLLNNHYVLMRLFDNINDEMNGPMDNIYNSSGEIVTINSHISPWSKLSWFQDFEETMIDTLDADISITNVHDGTVLVPLETPGLNSDTKMRYWINTNNDRFSMVVMGNPSLDYEKDRHLISACYCGKIESFDNSINDTAGNFALFTSSSTEPCNTVLSTERVDYEAGNYALTDADVANGTYDADELATFLSQCPWSTPCSSSAVYYIQLTDKKYFNREFWPRYVIVDSTGKPVTAYEPAYKRQFIVTEGKADMLQLTVDPSHEAFDDSYTIYVTFEYYQEKFLITSGVARDVFGNVIDVDKVKDFGANTSDGVTSIMMYHTRSKAYYQKHHMMFATTEEYMSKVMYGKSSYTGEYYADRIKVTHGNDGPRGTLGDLLVIDSSSLYALDELVINKDFEKDPDEYEETFVYFPITAPYSPLSDSPNARYGLAIKKAEVEPAYTDEFKILKIAMNELGKLTESWSPVDGDIFPRETTTNGCSVYWTVLEDTAWAGNESNLSSYVPVKLAVVNTSTYQGDLTSPLSPVSGITVAQGSKIADTTNSYVAVTGFDVNDSGEKIYYGIADGPIDSFGKDAQIKAVLYDGTAENEKFEYNVNGVPYGGVLGDTLPTGDIHLVDASPDKYLVLYSVKEEVVDGVERYSITKYGYAPLTESGQPKNELLQYPCAVNVYIEGGKGNMIYNGEVVNSININNDYNANFELALLPETGYSIEKVTVINSDDATVAPQEHTSFSTITVGGVDYKGITISSVTNNTQIKVQFKAD